MIAYVLVTALITSAKTSKLQLYFSTILGFEHIQNGSIIMIPQSSHAAQWQNITERVHYSASSSTVSLYTVFTIQQSYLQSYFHKLFGSTLTKGRETYRQITHTKQQLIPNKVNNVEI